MHHPIEEIIKQWDTQAVIFDLDGTLIDNNPFHLESWKQYLKKLGREISDEEYRRNINGRTNKDAIEYIYGKKMTNEEAMSYALKKEAIYRRLYEPYIKPVPGLLQFLETISNMNIPMAIATSGIQVNIDFMFEHIPIRQYFPLVVNSSHITKGKPDPEIYLKTASLLNISPEHCLVFEDSIVGIHSGQAAGMKVIAITTTHPKEELEQADLIISSYEADKFTA